MEKFKEEIPQEITSQGIIDNLMPDKFEATKLLAERLGFDVVMGHDNLLLLDLDDKAARSTFDHNLDVVKRIFGVEKIDAWVSKSGGDHQHVAVTLKQKATILERVAIQAALGSDPIREILTLVRLRNGVKEPSRLFRPKGVASEHSGPKL